MFEYYGDIHVYCLGVGAYEPLGSIFFRIINIQSYCPFPARLSLYIYIVDLEFLILHAKAFGLWKRRFLKVFNSGP